MLTTLPIVDDATRREFMALFGAAGLLTACGAGGAIDGAARPTGRTVTDDAGRSVTTPERPQRIVGAHDHVAAAALAQGEPLIAIGTRGGAVTRRPPASSTPRPDPAV